ncbi:MAG: Rossmann-like domain-containing protein [Candidatus Lokiarchaeia archaeon]
MDTAESLIKYLENELAPDLEEVKVSDVRIGLEYAGVMLSTGEGGVAHVLREDSSGYQVFNEAGELQGSSALNMMNLATSSNLIKAALGVATINSVSQTAFNKKPQLYPFTDVDILDLVKPGDKILMVGYMAPVIPKLMDKTSSINVIERRKIQSPIVSIAKEEQIEELSSDADIAIITGSTLVNRTVDNILKHCKGMREVVLIGPTASFIPQPLFERGATAVMGVNIYNPQKMLEVVSQAGGTRKLLKICAKKTAILKKDMKI